MLYKYSLSETFREFVLLKLSSIYTSLPHLKYPMHVWFWKKHVRVLFEGNILLTAWLQDLHRVNLTELTLFLSSAGDFLPPPPPPPPPVWFMLRFLVFRSEKRRNIHWLFSFLFSSLLSRLYFANKQSPVDATINRCWVTVRLHGNFVFNWSIWCIWNSGPFNNRCQCQEIIHQVNYSQINQLCSIIDLCLWTVFHCMLLIMHSSCSHSNALQQLSKFHELHPDQLTENKKRVGLRDRDRCRINPLRPSHPVCALPCNCWLQPSFLAAMQSESRLFPRIHHRTAARGTQWALIDTWPLCNKTCFSF